MIQNSVKKKISCINRIRQTLNSEIPHPGMECLMFNIDISMHPLWCGLCATTFDLLHPIETDKNPRSTLHLFISTPFTNFSSSAKS